MARIDRSTTLAAPAPAVWEAVKTPEAFRFVTRRIMSMPAIRRRQAPWREGETVTGWVFLFAVIPFSKHSIHVAQIDDGAMTMSSNEHGGPIRRWNHDIIVTALTEDSCSYRDVIEIEAGVLTPVVALCARGFYWMRQRRWKSLAQGLPGHSLRSPGEVGQWPRLVSVGRAR
jgi:hypothetical protein